jgi:hypothetical protein
MKLQRPESKAFAQMFQKNYAGKILGCHLQLLNAIRTGGYLPDRVINLILQYLTNRFVEKLCSSILYFLSSSVVCLRIVFATPFLHFVWFSACFTWLQSVFISVP